jgi:hypothetical protein
VHRPLGQQHQDGGADVATAAAPARSAAPSTARAGAEPESAGTETPAEARTEARTETRAERPVVAGVVAADKVAELATSLLAVFVQCAPCLWVEAEALDSGASRERPVCVWEWVIHMSSRFLEGQRPMRYRYDDDISKTIVMQRAVFSRLLDQGFVAATSAVAHQ